jgi:hypothetical protein
MRLCVDLTKNPLNLSNCREVDNDDHSFLQYINNLNNSNNYLYGFHISVAENLKNGCQTE